LHGYPLSDIRLTSEILRKEWLDERQRREKNDATRRILLLFPPVSGVLLQILTLTHTRKNDYDSMT